MKKLIAISEPQRKEPDRAEILRRIISVCEVNGYFITPKNAFYAWRLHSYDMNCSWGFAPESDDLLFNIIKAYCRAEEP